MLVEPIRFLRRTALGFGGARGDVAMKIGFVGVQIISRTNSVTTSQSEIPRPSRG